MKYLSWDIGIKNLSYCLMDEARNILNWEIINLSENKEVEEHKCDGLLKSLKKCDKKAVKYDVVSKRFFCTNVEDDYPESLCKFYLVEAGIRSTYIWAIYDLNKNQWFHH